MRNRKIFGIAAMAALALMALAASSASATTLYDGTVQLGTGAAIDFSIPSGASVTLDDTSGSAIDKCSTSTVKGKLSSGTTGSIEELTWGGCTFPTTTVTKGKLEVVWTSATKGVVVSDAEIRVKIVTAFEACEYGVEAGIFVGLLTTVSSGAATFDANAPVARLSHISPWCPESAKWSGIYTSTEPVNLRVESP